MFDSSILRGLCLVFITTGLAACGGTSTDGENLLNSPLDSTSQDGTVSTDGTESPQTGNDGETVNQAPSAVLSATPTSGTAALQVNVDASQSSDADGTIAAYQWHFGDGASSQGVATSHTYSVAGTYTLTLTVTDNAGSTDTATTTIQVSAASVNQPPSAVISADPSSGVASLLVNVNATQSTDDQGITGYSWNFGDGNSSQNAVTSHSYSQPGTYTLTLTVSDGQGLSDTASTQIHVFENLNNDGVIIPEGVTFFDDFEYAVDRNNSADPSGTDNPFTNLGGWTGVKSENTTGSYNGYLYTVTEIPGYSGSFPGGGSNRVLAIESRPGSMGGQTDFYLQYGDLTSSRETVPGNVWFQFWIYSNYYDDPTDQNDQLSEYESRFKFIYPCNVSYPCQQGELNWLYMLGYSTSEPFWANNDPTELFMTTNEPFNVSIDYELAEEWNQFKIGQTDVSENITPNRWTLVKLHYDTSTPSGTFEAWLKPLGGSWVKVAEWIDGVTPNFSWPVVNVGGHRVFRMPTTVNYVDSWIYLDDFAMATSEADLPVYPY